MDKNRLYVRGEELEDDLYVTIPQDEEHGKPLYKLLGNIEVLEPYIDALLKILSQYREYWECTPLTFEAIDDCVFNFSGDNMYCSLDNGETWLPVLGEYQQRGIRVSAGETVMWKGNATVQGENGIGSFSDEGDSYYNIKGNIMSLTHGDDFIGKSVVDYEFKNLFSGCTGLSSATDLILPSNVATSCYEGMFKGSGIEFAPILPATSLEESCYRYMFEGCEYLETAPDLPATELAELCYGRMFKQCGLLVEAPELPATALAEECYSGMFMDCDNLVKAPSLPATSLTEGCYAGMFNGCGELETAPDLMANTLVNRCYYNMFLDCEKLNYIKMLATYVSASDCLSSWVSGVASSGTFVKAMSSSLPEGINGIPQGWTVVTV